jgi:sterol 24-C-methyltransferase
VQDKYDPNNARHAKCKAEIELGNGLPDLNTCVGAMAMLQEAGFEVRVK